MKKEKKQKAFTLIELIVVLAIVAILLVLVVPKVTNYVKDARETAATNNAAAVLHAAELYIAENEKDGKDPSGTFSSSTEKNLSNYLSNINADDTYTVTITYDKDAKDYKITGSYTTGETTVAIPSLTIQDKTT